MSRELVPLPVPAGSAALEILPALGRMLDGHGPALLPVPAGAGPGAVHALAGPLAPEEDDPDDPTALVVATSGSTGTPKGALLPVSALHASAAGTAERLGLGPSDRPHWLLALPADHIAGVQVLLRAVAAGTTPGALDGPFTAAGFVAATRALPDGPRVVSLVPTQLHRLLADADGTAAAASYHAILLGGAAAGPDLLDRAGDAGLRLVTTYGMSETAGGCVYDGRPLPGVEVLLDDDRIVLQGPVVARGYRHRPGDPAFEHDTRGRRFRTSDLGRWTDGRLQVLGRADDVLVTGGVKISPSVVEAAVLQVPGVAAALLTAVPDAEWGDRLVLLVVPGAGTTADPADARPTRPAGSDGSHPADAALVERIRRAAAAVHRAAVPAHVLSCRELPLRGIGKPDRDAGRALAARWLSAPGPLHAD